MIPLHGYNYKHQTLCSQCTREAATRKCRPPAAIPDVTITAIIAHCRTFSSRHGNIAISAPRWWTFAIPCLHNVTVTLPCNLQDCTVAYVGVAERFHVVLARYKQKTMLAEYSRRNLDIPRFPWFSANSMIRDFVKSLLTLCVTVISHKCVWSRTLGGKWKVWARQRTWKGLKAVPVVPTSRLSLFKRIKPPRKRRACFALSRQKRNSMLFCLSSFCRRRHFPRW